MWANVSSPASTNDGITFGAFYSHTGLPFTLKSLYVASVSASTIKIVTYAANADGTVGQDATGGDGWAVVTEEVFDVESTMTQIVLPASFKGIRAVRMFATKSRDVGNVDYQSFAIDDVVVQEDC